MKKTNLKKLALMGIAGVLMAQAQGNAAQQNGSYNGSNQYVAAMDSMQSSSKMSESDLLQKLSPEGKATYQSLSKEGKDLALKLANQSCQGKNGCKGMNSCKSTENACAGKAGCQGKSNGPFTDKNMAVKVAAQKMAEKRSEAMRNSSK
jgi:hypothetical protein